MGMPIAEGARPCGRTRNFLASVASCLCVLSLVLVTVPEEAGGQEGSGCETSHFDATEVPTAIPDRGNVTSSLVVPEGERVDRVEVSVSVSHPFVSDLRLELVSPAGKRVVLAEAVGMWGDDFSGTTFSDQTTASIISSLPPFSGQYRPVEPLAAFSGSARAGTWKLKVTDLRARYSGQLEAWGLTLVTCADPTVTRKRAGAPDPAPLPEGVPTGSEAVEGRLITVTSTDGGVSNGDVSTLDALETDPGPDGISLREAIEATNNDPGTYTVRFDASLKGGTISFTNGLPVLTGGGLFIDGDLDGDGRPDVTLVDQPDFGGGWGFNVASTGNRLHALTLQGFSMGVVFTAMRDGAAETPLLKETTFARNVVSGLLFEDVAASIAIYPTLWHNECQESPCSTRSRWFDTRLVGNTIESQREGGISVGWGADSGDRMRRITVAGNVIHTGEEGSGSGPNAIDLGIGTQGTKDNLISDALVAYNEIEMGWVGKAIQVLAGQGGRSGNVIEDVRIVGNGVRFSGDPFPGGPAGGAEGISMLVSDGCWGHDIPCHNVVRRIEVVGNVLEGYYSGVRVGEPCCEGPPRNILTDIRIAANVIKGIIAAPQEFLKPWGVVIAGLNRPSVSNVSVDSNTIVQRVVSPKAGSAGNLIAGGIALLGGLETNKSVRRVSITNNRVATKLVGILVLAGAPDRTTRQGEVIGNRVSRVKLRGNVITRVPVLATRWFPRLKGISLIGGLAGPARPTRRWKVRKNAVTCVTVRHNAVAGTGRGVAVLPNLGAGASRNVAKLGGC